MILILAGVALATLTGEGNIIGNAENALGKYNNSVASEQQLLNEIEKYFQNYLEGGNQATSPEPPEVDENGLSMENVTIKPDPNSNVQIVIPVGFAPVILTGSNSTYSLPGQNGSVKEIMPADQWYSITDEQIDQGIVIVDNPITYDGGNSTGTTPDFNEYVWVPITDDNDFDRVAWNSRYWDWENWQYAEHPLSDTKIESFFWEETESNEYASMIASVDYYKGFYIGRYEASDNGNGIAQSKRNQNAWAKVSFTQASEACANNPKENMHVIYGIEWDSTLNWLIGNAKILDTKSNKIKEMTLADIQNDSSCWGNYMNSEGDAAIGKGTLQNTGYNETWKANNIYDLAGNISEWTKEKYSIEDVRAIRGCNCTNNGNEAPVADRSCTYENKMNDLRRFSY